MKKLFSLLIFLHLCVSAVFADEIRFIQVDGLKYNPKSEASVKAFDSMIESINKQKNVDFVIFSGDNIAKPDKEYLKEFLKSAKQLNSPIYIALGNKDINKKKGLGKTEYMKTFRKNIRFRSFMKNPNYSFIQKDVIFIVADGSKEFVATPNGYYKSETIELLKNKLEKSKGKNVIIIQHFPVVPPSIKDGYLTYKAEEYLNLISQYPNIKAVFSGLFGVNDERNVKGVLHVSTESAPTYRVVDIIDCETQNPVIWSSVVQ